MGCQRTHGWSRYFQKLTFDGSYLVSYTANREAPEAEWSTWENDVWLADTATGEVTRTELGGGLVYRFALAENSALFFRIGQDGDEALLVDLTPGAATFGQVTQRIPLEPLTGGPTNGGSPWEAKSRITAITPDGRWGFVTAGGDGKLVVIDLEAGAIATTTNVPTPLSTGGIMAVFGTPMDFLDTIGR